ncbi:hypothetical protein ACS0TY_019864 [Phlomoides rotata]
MGKKEKSAKRKHREREEATEVQLQKSIGEKYVTVTDDLNEPTMGEKLAGLNLEGKDIAPNLEVVDLAKPPSADSVYILLKQALRADDRALLLDCLYRQDEKVIANSLGPLNPSDVLKFLQSLVPLIHLRGAVLACALPWLKSLLLQHSSSIMSQESSLAALNSLYQLIESRVSTYNRALQLSSCLDLLYAEVVDDGMEESYTVTPFIYEDDSDDDEDDGCSDVSMEGDDGDQDGNEPAASYSDDEMNGEISD